MTDPTFRAAVRGFALAALVVATMTGGTIRSAWALTAAEWAQAQTNFKAANPAGTTLDQAQFKAFIDLNAAAQIGRAARIKSNNAYGRAFTVVDADKNGLVTWDEYAKAQ